MMTTATSSLIAKLASLSLMVSPASNEPAYCHKNCQLSNDGVALIKLFEGYSPYIYKDSAGLPTIGIGHLIVKGEKFNQPMLPDDAHKLLIKDASVAVRGVNKSVNVKLKQTQADPLISFAFNLGTGALQGSTLLKKVNKNLHDQVPSEFMKWIKARVDGKLEVIQGLVNRRTAEANWYKQ